MRDGVKLGLVLVLAAAAGCVYPGQEPTGLELSWRFVEGNPLDGEDGIHVRTCTGADVSWIDIALADLDDEDRADEFRFDCELGFQTVVDFQTTASDAYIRLRPGDYTITVSAVDGEGGVEVVADEEVTVAGRQITVQPYVVTRETFDWTIELSSTDACDTLSLSLFYEDPATDLATLGEDDDATDLPYRGSLATDRGLPITGETVVCDGDLAGGHFVSQMDRGIYRLEVTVDDQSCEIRLALDPDHPDTALDLAALPCNG